MFENYQKYWINQANLRSLKKELPLVDTRKGVLSQLDEFASSFCKVILKKYYSYEEKKQSINQGSSEIEKKLNIEAMDNIAKIYAIEHMNPLFDGVQKITTLLRKVQTHFGQFKTVLENPAKDAPEKATALIAETHSVRHELNQVLIELALKAEAVAIQIQTQTALGEKIGPAFKTNPVIFLMGVPLMVKKETGLTGIPIEEAVRKIEGIKQTRSAAQGVEPLYLLFLNAIQSLRKMEKGMAQCLGGVFKIPSGFEFGAKKSAVLSTVEKLNAPVEEDEKSSPPVLAPPRKEEDPFIKEVSSQLSCPLSKKLFRDPVTIETGYTFEKEEIAKHLKDHDVCPQTQVRLTSKVMIPNFAIKAISQRFGACPDGKKGNFFQQIPDFESPTLLEPFKEPVLVSSGITLDKEEAEILFAKDGICYITRQQLDPKIKIPNRTLSNLMQAVAKKAFPEHPINMDEEKM
jgi:hypothetical protein